MGIRAFTNPISNAVVLSQFNLGEAMDTAARMQLPLRCLPQFLHETMHHWCFESPVGFAISLLQMRARRRAASARRGLIRDSHRRLIAQDLAKINGFLDFTRPLAEGMALFCEHDMQLGDSEVIGRPALFTGIMFAGRQKDSSDYLRLAPELIATARLKPSHIRRKADLLLQPFSGSGEGYLAGYLYLKMLYRIVAERCASYSDTEFFLHCLRRWIYDDWDLVDLLLDNSNDYERWVETMVPYCQQRVTDFLALDDRELHTFAQRGLSREADEFEYRGPCLELKSYAHPVRAARNTQSGKKRLQALLDELFRREPKDAALKIMFASDLELIGLRTTVTLGHGTFEALVTKGKMLHLMTEGVPFPVFATGAPSTLQQGWKEPVNVELLLTTAPTGLYQFIISRAGLISSQSFGENQEVPAYLQTRMVNWEERHKKMDEEDRGISDVTPKTVPLTTGISGWFFLS